MYRIVLKSAVLLLVVALSVAAGVYAYVNFINRSHSEHRLSIETIQRMGKLELVRFNVKDFVKQTQARPFYLPDAKALLIVVGHVSAGIDLEKISKDDFSATANQITIKLPRPEILLTKVVHEESEVYDIKRGFLRTPKLIEEAWREAEKAIREIAIKQGYEDICIKNARILLEPLFQELAGTRKVVIEFKS